ncbi:MAG: type II toxin-antitoxin system RelE/ParE family toxin [Trueperella sp.]|uniref:type II toxin-antitoxin system RelE family toxin n=1 Tax=Trueperella sp. TaxID=2699835 RepID=UPI002A91B11D|nr:type II toxin-antitoxin system RelE/ParE family toxin [Trueperella sp.]MDY5403456.1 type II toxin-antitoxin system RelE/ParE family toxin [Trueperella sp.]
MPEYSVSYSRSAAKSFRSFHPQVQRRLKEAIEALASDPYPSGSIKILGGEGERRIRVGDYRIIYDVDDGRLLILVLSVGHRREVYR